MQPCTSQLPAKRLEKAWRPTMLAVRHLTEYAVYEVCVCPEIGVQKHLEIIIDVLCEVLPYAFLTSLMLPRRLSEHGLGVSASGRELYTVGMSEFRHRSRPSAWKEKYTRQVKLQLRSEFLVCQEAHSLALQQPRRNGDPRCLESSPPAKRIYCVLCTK